MVSNPKLLLISQLKWLIMCCLLYICRFVFDCYLSVMMLVEYIIVIWDALSLERLELNSWLIKLGLSMYWILRMLVIAFG